MLRQQWEELKACEDTPVVVDVEATPLAGVAHDALVVAAIATQQGPAKAGISIFRYDEKDQPTPINKDDYDVWTNLDAHPALRGMIAAASTSYDDNFRAFSAEHVFLVKCKPGREHWLPELPAHVKILLRST
jgi:hypothetical protein